MIGIFDSGLGGLTVVKALTDKLPNYSIIYFGDTARLPYGTKESRLIRAWSHQNVAWLKNKGAKVIVVACHTSSTIAGQELKKDFALPVFEMTTPLLEIVKENQGRRLGIIGTPATIQSGFYQNQFRESNPQVFFQACPLFIPLVEENWIDKPGTKAIVEATLAPLKNHKIEVLVLACTHYPLLRKIIQETLPHVQILDPAQQLAANLKNFLEQHPEIDKILKKGSHQFFFSAHPYHLPSISRAFLGEEIQANIVFSYE